MNCDVIRDLMILCADGGCCEESRRLVEEHIQSCDECKAMFEEMRTELAAPDTPCGPSDLPRLKRVHDWKASVMQSVTLFLSFALLVFGVAREAATPTGNRNGLWAVAVIVPVTGFLLSLANWYFVRLYPNRKAFSLCSLLATLMLIICGYAWAAVHYRNEWEGLFGNGGTAYAFLIAGAVLSVAFCVLSVLLSRKYAAMLGKE